MNIGFFTGARSEYHILKRLLSEVQQHAVFEYKLYVSGIHLLKEFGYTANDIVQDGFKIYKKIPIYEEHQAPGVQDFTKAITKFYDAFKQEEISLMFVFGDRMEAYSAALACHFLGIRIAHFGGGTISKGSNDNIYRYNISNLATYHFSTNKLNAKRLRSLPAINKANIFNVGSLAVESIKRFLKTSVSITDFIAVQKNNYALMTFHPATGTEETYHDTIISTVDFLLGKGCEVLITYPNNDYGFQEIIDAIEAVRVKKGVHVVENLGGIKYYAAIRDSLFLIGNTSSGIIEAPYFNTPTINIGMRQAGRDCEPGIISIPNRTDMILPILDEMFKLNWPPIKNNHLYGDGNTTRRVIRTLEKLFPSSSDAHNAKN